MRKSPHVLIEPGISRPSQGLKSFATSIGLGTSDATEVLRHSRLVTVKDTMNGPDLARPEWRDIWNRKLKLGLGETLLFKSLTTSKVCWEERLGVEGLCVEWSFPLQTTSVGKRSFGASQADCLVYKRDGRDYVKVVPAESKMWGDLRSSIIQKSFENVVYSIIKTFSRIDGYIIKVPHGFLMSTFFNYMSKKGTIVTKLIGGTVMEYRFMHAGTPREALVTMRMGTRDGRGSWSSVIFQGTFAYYAEPFPITADQATAYVNGLMDAMDAHRRGINFSPPILPAPATSSGVRVTRHVKSLKRYDDVLLAIARSTAAGYPISNVAISRLLGIPVESLKRLFESLVNSGQIRQVETDPPIHVPAIQARTTYYSEWIEVTANVKASWYALPETGPGPHVDLAMKERTYRAKARASLNDSNFVLEAMNELFTEISASSRADVRKASIKEALTRRMELFFDDLFYATGVRFILG